MSKERSHIQSLIALLSRCPGLDILAGPRIEVTPMSGGRSGAQVFKAVLPHGSGQTPKPTALIIKVAPPLAASQERDNYERFVRHRLPRDLRPELLGFVQSDGIAALCYGYAGGDPKNPPDSLTTLLARGNAEAVDIVLHGLFDRLEDGWYAPRAFRNESHIAERYRQRFFKEHASIRENEKRLAAYAARHFDATLHKVGYAIDTLSFPSPAAALFGALGRMSYRSCIQHGDLNSDNIVVELGAGTVRLVDFDNTGPGHVFEDLVSTEASIRINFPSTASNTRILDTERRIALGLPTDHDDAYAKAIRAVRQTARRLFGRHESETHYAYSVAAIGLRLMQATDLQDFAHARIVASTLWTTKVLMESNDR